MLGRVWSAAEQAAALTTATFEEFDALFPGRTVDAWRIKRNRALAVQRVTGLIDELRADQDPRTQCRFCVWLAGRSRAEQVEWAGALPDRSFTHSSLFRAARKRGYGGGVGSLESHRKNGHEVTP